MFARLEELEQCPYLQLHAFEQRDLLILRQERALESHAGHLLQPGPREPQVLVSLPVLVGQGGCRIRAGCRCLA